MSHTYAPELDEARLLSLTNPHSAALKPVCAEAEQAGISGISHLIVDTPIGSLLLAATEKGLVRVAFECEGHEAVLDSLAAKFGSRILRAPESLDAAARELEEYFSGRRTRFDLQLDYSLSSGFRQLVQRELSRIPYGHTRSYKDVAQVVGNPKAVIAVGSACATNPLPVVVPCHRVLRSDGALGGYLGGLDAKTALLSLETTA